jgi:hypothetical protein
VSKPPNWEWDGKFWTQRQDMGLPQRAYSAIVYDHHRERTVLFGGTRISDFGDTWELEIGHGG